ncbi:MAG TPA: PIN domain-containing protein [Luteibacter sp.]|jgi:hypothetical protein|uniref:PIN domain-containing protein n=1 Tax=Luteibacter sp. TaxID=1886636 RepID=UPI002F41B401
MPLIDGNDLAGQMLAHGIGAICIDTSTYEKNAFAFDKGLLAQCPGIRESGLRLLMVDVVEREVRAHLASKTEEQVKTLRKELRSARQSGLVDDVAVDLMAFQEFDGCRHAIARLDEFKGSAGVEVVVVAEHCDLQRLVDDYFSSQPPFAANSKKKSEFPDALTLLALEAFGDGMQRGILVVSEDKGWHDYAANSRTVFAGPDLATVLRSLPDKEDVHLRDAALAVSGDDFVALKGRIEFELNGLPIYAEVDAGYPAEAEVDSVSLTYLPEPAADGSDFRAIRITDGSLVVSWTAQAKIHYDASLSVSIRDPIDRDYVDLPGMSVEGEEEVELEILITFDRRGGVAHPRITFDTADIVEKDLWLDLGYVEYSLAGED